MRFSWGLILIVSLAFGGLACDSGSGEGGGEVTSDAALHGFMQAIASDLAKVLAEVAPSDVLAAEKAPGEQNTAACPEGGSATWTESDFGGGTLNLEACAMRGLNVTGDLGGYLSVEPSLDGMTAGYVNADNMRSVGLLTVTGGYSASLNVTSLSLSADLPEPSDDLTYWEVRATTEEGEPLCAWSGSASCDDITLF